MPFKKNLSREEISAADKNLKILSVYFANFPFPVTLTTMDGKILFSNSAITKVLGYTAEEMMRLKTKDVYASEEERKTMLEIVKKEGHANHYSAKLKRKGGTEVSVKLNVTPIPDKEHVFLLTMVEDDSWVQSLESRLWEIDKKFKFLYENSNDAIMLLSSPDWKFITGNPATLRMFNIKKEEKFTSLGPWDLSPEYQPDGKLSSVKAKEMIEKAVKEGSNFFEWTHKKCTGEEFFATVFLVRISATSEKVAIQAIVRDISVQKEEEEGLRKFMETTKTKLSEIVPIVEKLPLDKPPAGTNEFNYLLSIMDKIIEYLKSKNIHLEHVRKAMTSLAEDFSMEKEKLAESNNRIETIIKSIGDGVMVIDSNEVVVFFNPAAEKISGWNASEVVGKKCCDTLNFYSEENDLMPNALIRETLKTGKIKKLGSQAVLKVKSGAMIPVADCISPLLDANGKVQGSVVIFSDASREREIDRAKSEFVSLASHQLRTPISIVAWFMEMLLSGEVGELNEKQKEYLEEISRSNQRMGSMVLMLLNISRIEMGTFIIEPAVTDMKKFIDANLSSFRPLLEKKNILMKVKMEKDLPLIAVDRKLLGIVMDNLVSNALSYTLSGGNIIVSVTKNAKNMVIEVTDNGIGIPKSAQPKMFSKLFRADNAKETDTDGTGIGLYISKSIVERWNGTISFTSPTTERVALDGKKESVGTSFFVTIPLKGMSKKEGTTELIAK
ncbi:MAG: PAS domain S-box protein [Candidatus Paceibacterota bacterium]